MNNIQVVPLTSFIAVEDYSPSSEQMEQEEDIILNIKAREEKILAHRRT
jgi:hypothetical protein